MKKIYLLAVALAGEKHRAVHKLVVQHGQPALFGIRVSAGGACQNGIAVFFGLV